MGVLRIKEDVDELLDRDPFELFHIDEPVVKTRAHHLLRKARPEVLGLAFIAVVSAFLIAAATFWSMQQDVRDPAGSPYAYFEVRVVDGDGRPVAGALVRQGTRQVGVTDSFGEWRRFLKVDLGSSVTLDFTKRTPTGVLTATKTLAVPGELPKSGDLEITGSVRLSASGGFHDAPKVEEELPAAAGADEVVQEITEVPEGEALIVAPTRDLSRVWIMASGEVGKDMDDVLQSLRRRARELGVKVDPQSPFRLTLKHVALPNGQDPLLHVEGSYGEGSMRTRSFAFLRNYAKTPRDTARGILWAVTLHAGKEYSAYKEGAEWRLRAPAEALWHLEEGSHVVDGQGELHTVLGKAENGDYRLAQTARGAGPCPEGEAVASCPVKASTLAEVPPVRAWRRQYLRILTDASQPGLEVFVSGYAAQQVKPGLWAYWGEDGGFANLTILRAGEAVHRGRVSAEPGRRPVVSLPGPVLSRR